jgi:hypothetical protein
LLWSLFDLLNYENEQVWAVCVPEDLAALRGKFAGYGKIFIREMMKVPWCRGSSCVVERS